MFNLDATCPECGKKFSPVNASQVEGRHPKNWQEVVQRSQALQCPHCHVHLKPEMKSYWPLLLLIPVIISYRLLPIEIATGVFLLVGLYIAYKVRASVKYKALK